jgi:hypothetical protein
LKPGQISNTDFELSILITRTIKLNKPVTTRDSYIINKALAYAIAWIDSLPEEQQEASDRDDMVAVLIARIPSPLEREVLAHGVECHTGVLTDFTNWKLESEELPF